MNPYRKLEAEYEQFRCRVANPIQRHMFTFHKSDLDAQVSFVMTTVRERVLAANQIGYDCVLKVENGDLVILYQKRI